jgi:hypothetical protein
MILHPSRLQSRSIKPVHWILAGATGLLFCVGIAAFVVLRTARLLPAFYAAALAQPIEEQKAAGQRFEQSALTLHNELHAPGRRSVRFTEDEINGWLAAELPAKFPQALPSGIGDPRVSIQPRTMQLAMRARQGAIESVVLLSAEVFLSSEPNEIAVRLKRAQLGALPLPLAQIRDRFEDLAGNSNVRLRWSEMDGDPVVLIKLVFELAKPGEASVMLEAIDLGDREIAISWRGDTSAAAPILADSSESSAEKQR